MRQHILGIALATAVVGVGLATVASTASATTDSATVRQSQEAVRVNDVMRGTTTITVDAAQAKAVKSASLKITSLYRRSGDESIVLPIVGYPKDGTIEHLGGLAIMGKASVATISTLTLDVGRGVVTGRVGLSRKAVDVFTVGPVTPAGLTLTLTGNAAATLNETLDVEVFTKTSPAAYAKVSLR